jgi:hypothetical protein
MIAEENEDEIDGKVTQNRNPNLAKSLIVKDLNRQNISTANVFGRDSLSGFEEGLSCDIGDRTTTRTKKKGKKKKKADAGDT